MPSARLQLPDIALTLPQRVPHVLHLGLKRFEFLAKVGRLALEGLRDIPFLHERPLLLLSLQAKLLVVVALLLHASTRGTGPNTQCECPTLPLNPRA